MGKDKTKKRKVSVLRPMAYIKLSLLFTEKWPILAREASLSLPFYLEHCLSQIMIKAPKSRNFCLLYESDSEVLKFCQ